MENTTTESKVDLYVVLDNKQKRQFCIVTPNEDERMGSTVDSKKINGIRIPLIQINNRVINPNDILRLDIYFKGLLPTIDIRINDWGNQIQHFDLQGKNASAKVVLLTPAEGVYKKMKMEFYLTSTNCYDLVIEYSGVMKIVDLELSRIECWGALSTFDFVKKICEQTGMGLCVSPKCEEINDLISRFFTAKSFKTALQEQIPMGGDENSLFDCWIDGVGNINLVNIKYLYDTCFLVNTNSDGTIKSVGCGIDPLDLRIMCIVNDITNDANIDLILVDELPRLISNINTLGFSNLSVAKDKWIVNNDALYQIGVKRNYNTLSLDGANENNDNNISNYNQTINEPSADGWATEDYEFSTDYYLGEEMGDTPILMQQLENKCFFDRLRTKRLWVEMKFPNYGLIRGMVIGVLIVSDDMTLKIAAPQKENPNYLSDNQISPSTALTMFSENKPIATIDGLFYIDEIVISYYGGDIHQCLYLIPFSDLSCINNYIKVNNE